MIGRCTRTEAWETCKKIALKSMTEKQFADIWFFEVLACVSPDGNEDLLHDDDWFDIRQVIVKHANNILAPTRQIIDQIVTNQRKRQKWFAEFWAEHQRENRFRAFHLGEGPFGEWTCGIIDESEPSRTTEGLTIAYTNTPELAVFIQTLLMENQDRMPKIEKRLEQSLSEVGFKFDYSLCDR